MKLKLNIVPRSVRSVDSDRGRKVRILIRLACAISVSILLAGLLAALPALGDQTTKSNNPTVIALADAIKLLSPGDRAALAAALLNDNRDNSHATVRLAQAVKSQTAPVSTARTSSSGEYTSLIVDAESLGIERCMSPKIRKSDGSEVWGTLPVSPDYAIDPGIASFVPDMDAARKCSRCGANPLVVQATGVFMLGDRRQPVVSDSDAELITRENAKSKFADNCNVIFIIGK